MSQAEREHEVSRRDECLDFLNINQFDVAKKIDITKTATLYVDTDSERFLLYDFSENNTDDFRLLSFSDIIKVEVHEDDMVVQKASLGGAVVGSLIAGDVGAIVGSQVTPKSKSTCRSMSIKLTLKDVLNPYIEINIIKKRGDMKFKKAGAIYKDLTKNVDLTIATFLAMKES